MEELLFVKYSNERAQEFSIRTELREDDNGEKKIVKVPTNNLAAKHVENMYDAYLNLVKQYEDADVKINKCDYSGGIAKFEYLCGDTLQEKIDDYIKDNQWNRVYEIVDRIVNLILDKATNDFVYTDEFKHIFGNVGGIENCKCSEVTDVDMIFSNIIINDKINIIDYEWTFFFPIPVKYVIFRLCFFLIHQCSVNQSITIEQLMERYGISENEYYIFIEMEDNFQKYIKGSRETLRERGTSNMTHIRSINDINKLYIDNPEGLYVNVYVNDAERGIKKKITQENILIGGSFAKLIKTPNKIIEIEITCGCGLLIFKKADFNVLSNNGMKIAENTYLYIADRMKLSIENTSDENTIDLDFSVVRVDVEGVTNIKNAIDGFVLENKRLSGVI